MKRRRAPRRAIARALESDQAAVPDQSYSKFPDLRKCGARFRRGDDRVTVIR